MKAKIPSILVIFGLVIVGLAVFSMAMDSIAVYNEYVLKEQKRLAREAGNIVFEISGGYGNGPLLHIAIDILSILGFLGLRKSNPIFATVLAGIPFLIFVHSYINSWIGFRLLSASSIDQSYGELLLLAIHPVEVFVFASVSLLFFWQVITLCRSHFSTPPKITLLP